MPRNKRMPEAVLAAQPQVRTKVPPCVSGTTEQPQQPGTPQQLTGDPSATARLGNSWQRSHQNLPPLVTTPQGPPVATVSTGQFPCSRVQSESCPLRAEPAPSLLPGQGEELSPAKACWGQALIDSVLGPPPPASSLGGQAWCPPLSQGPGSCSPHGLWDFLQHHLEHTVKIPWLQDKHSTLKTKAHPREDSSHSSNPPCGPAATGTFLLPCGLSPHWGNQGLPGREPWLRDWGPLQSQDWHAHLCWAWGTGRLLAVPSTCLKHQGFQGLNDGLRGRPAVLPTGAAGKAPHAPPLLVTYRASLWESRAV